MISNVATVIASSWCAGHVHEGDAEPLLDLRRSFGAHAGEQLRSAPSGCRRATHAPRMRIDPELAFAPLYCPRRDATTCGALPSRIGRSASSEPAPMRPSSSTTLPLRGRGPSAMPRAACEGIVSAAGCVPLRAGRAWSRSRTAAPWCAARRRRTGTEATRGDNGYKISEAVP